MSNHKQNMDFVGNEEGYNVFKNKDGFMEGYKKTGKQDRNGQGTYVKRVVSNQTTIEGFGKYIRGLRNRTPVKDKPLKPSELPNLDFPE